MRLYEVDRRRGPILFIVSGVHINVHIQTYLILNLRTVTV